MTAAHLFWATINALWQSAAIALLVGVGLRFIPRTTAAQRYALWGAVLVAAALLPIADLAMPSREIALPVHAPPAPVVARVVADVVPQIAPQAVVMNQPVLAQPRPHLPDPLLLVWLGVTGAMLVRLGFAYQSLRRVKSTLVPSDDLTARVKNFAGYWSRHTVVGVSPHVAEPCAIGFLHPAIALSTEMVATLPDGDLERVLRHEYAHVRRYDDYVNLLQRLAAALLWFNPVVHVAGRAMAIEREIACDDAAAAGSDERVAFARCLYEIARSAPRRRHAAASGFIGTRRQIAVRVARLVERNHNASTRLGSFAKVTAIIVLAVSLALAGVRLTALAVPRPSPSALQLTASSEPPIEKPVTRVEPALKVAPPKAKPAKVKPVEKTNPVTVETTAETETKTETKNESKTETETKTEFKPEFTYERVVAEATAMPSPPRIPAAAPVLAPTPMDWRVHPHLMMRSPRVSGPGLMDALSSAGFKDLSVDDLVMLANRGVSPALIAELHAHGLTPMPAESLVRIADSGVTGMYIGGLAQLGYGNLSVEDYIRLRNAGVTLEFVQRLQRSGLLNHRATVDELIKLANAGV